MKNFAQLYRALDLSTKTNSRIKVLTEYFKLAEDSDKVWAIALLSSKRPKRIITTSILRECCLELGDLPLWLFEESYNMVGDLAETIALIAPNPIHTSENSLTEWINIILDLKNKDEHTKKEVIQNAWKCLDQDERFLFNKLITGGVRISVSQRTMIIALSKYAGIEENKITHRLSAKWEPTNTSFEELVLNSNETEDLSKLYPFNRIQELDQNIEELGDPKEWTAERKWDGIRVQVILRQNEFYLWSIDEELIGDKFPELDLLKNCLNYDVVIDGELLPFKDGKILNFNSLKSRLTRKNVIKKHLIEEPIVIIASDLLEYKGEDIRDQSLRKRRKLLDAVINEMSSDKLLFSDEVNFNSWNALEVERKNSRAYYSDGIVLKKKQSPYHSDAENSNWWICKVDSLTIDAVLIYVQRGIGQKAKTYTDFTFALKNGDALIPFTKANSGLSKEEIEEISAFVKKNTNEKFGPVRSISPELVFEIAFDGIAKSSRHKSGVILRNPRIEKWRKESSMDEINTLIDLMSFLSS